MKEEKADDDVRPIRNGVKANQKEICWRRKEKEVLENIKCFFKLVFPDSNPARRRKIFFSDCPPKIIFQLFLFFSVLFSVMSWKN